MLVLTLVAYCPLKVGSNSAAFTSHAYQYKWLLSAVFLEGYVPATVVIILFSFALVLVVGAFYLVFQKDWNIIRVFDELGSVKKKHKYAKDAVRILMTFSYWMIYLSINVCYVILQHSLKGVVLSLLEFFVNIVNNVMLWLLPSVIKKLFPDSPRSRWATWLVTLIIVFSK